MMLQIDFWEFVLGVAGLIAFISAGVWAFARLIGGQFARNLESRFEDLNRSRGEANQALENRFDAMQESFDAKHRENKQHWDERFRGVDASSRANEHALLKLRAELPNDYVRREDWIRFSGTIDSKLDMLRTMLDSVREKISARG